MLKLRRQPDDGRYDGKFSDIVVDIPACDEPTRVVITYVGRYDDRQVEIGVDAPRDVGILRGELVGRDDPKPTAVLDEAGNDDGEWSPPDRGDEPEFGAGVFRRDWDWRPE